MSLSPVDKRSYRAFSFPPPATLERYRPLTPKERVIAVIKHKGPGRVPIVIGVSNATGIKMKPYRGIKERIGVNAPDRYLYD